MRLILVTLLSSISLFAELLSVGVKGGVPIGDAFDAVRADQGQNFTQTHRYLIGPTAQLNLPLGFSVEVDALYKRLGFQYQQNNVDGIVTVQTVANSWEFPVLIKWAFLPGPVRPFVDAGASFRHISAVDEGFVFGGGVELKLGRLRITPELRYTRWGGDVFRDPVNVLVNTHRNQGDFLVGITF